MKEFDLAYGNCNRILSAVNKLEAALLFRYAKMTPDDLPIVEIGSDKGFSTVLLAQTGKKVIAIDPHAVAEYKDPETGLSGAHDANDYKQFKANTAKYANIEHIRKFSTDVKPFGPIGFMFIDGNHADPHPQEDYNHFKAELTEGAFVGWHDYGLFPGVKRAIDKLIDAGEVELVEVVETMAITKNLIKPKKKAESKKKDK